jgi:hypothetical protein
MKGERDGRRSGPRHATCESGPIGVLPLIGQRNHILCAAQVDWRLSGLEERAEVCFYAQGQTIEIVAAFEDGYETAVGVVGRY